MFFEIDVLKSFAKLRGKNVCWSLFSTIFQTRRPKTSLKKDSSQVFSAFSANFLRTSFLRKTTGQLLLFRVWGFSHNYFRVWWDFFKIWNFSCLWRGFRFIMFCFCFTPTGNYMFKVNNRNTRARDKICSKLTVKTPERGSLQR